MYNTCTYSPLQMYTAIIKINNVYFLNINIFIMDSICISASKVYTDYTCLSLMCRYIYLFIKSFILVMVQMRIYS